MGPEATTGNSPLGRYRFPAELRWALAAGAVLGSGVVAIAGLRDHHMAHHLILYSPVVVMALLAAIVPMTRIAPDGIHRWWSSQKANVPWEQVRAIEESGLPSTDVTSTRCTPASSTTTPSC